MAILTISHEATPKPTPGWNQFRGVSDWLSGDRARDLYPLHVAGYQRRSSLFEQASKLPQCIISSGEGGLPPTRRHLRRRRRFVQQPRRDQYEKVPGRRGNPPRFRETVDVPFLFPNPSAQVPPLFFGWGRSKETRLKSGRGILKKRKGTLLASIPMSYDLERKDSGRNDRGLIQEEQE